MPRRSRPGPVASHETKDLASASPINSLLQTVVEEEEIDDEIRHLFTVFQTR
jgi:hypothetical protein